YALVGDDTLKRKVVIALFLFVIGCGVVYGSGLTRDVRQKLESIRMASSVYDRKGRIIGNLYYSNRVWVPGGRIGKELKNAVVAIEDSRFYQHNGVDVRGMARAVVRDIIAGGAAEGGSTITQQLAKISLLSSKKTLSRKLQDIEYAMEIERNYTKREILEMYLNSVYLAHGNVGVEAASRYYFGKSANQLTLAQSALLAGMIQSPENYSPIKHPAVAKRRRNIVLGRMLELKYINKSQYRKAVASSLSVVKREETSSIAGYFLAYIREFLIEKQGFTEEQLRFGGYKIYTTLDLDMQNNAERTMLSLPKVATRVQPQGAIVSLDPKTGGILAMVGGRSYAESQYNRAVYSYRQPGSAVKPFIFATAIEKGYTASSMMVDRPLSIGLPNGTTWSPENYDRKFRGRLTLRAALRDSVNTVAVQLLQEVGIDAVAGQMEKMGITSLVKDGPNNDLNLAPLALGGLTKGATPLELSAAYTAFANRGIYSKPYAVRRIVDQDGITVRNYSPIRHRALSPQTAFIMTMLMEDVVNSGTGVGAKLPGQPVAGKTGTSSEYTNAWFVGYTPNVLTTIWIGNDQQGKAMKYKNLNIGSGSATRMWSGYMRRVMNGKPPLHFVQPPGIIWADVDPNSGLAIPEWMAGNSYKEVFRADNVPESMAYKVWRKLFGGNNNQGENPQEQTAPENQGNPDQQNDTETIGG
ncbi:MAG TPA: PBP1A family penicillin-binding protein, partial [Bacillota bacterium]|nr:PBP1A family penicillin-binding protein [Bacillota bacterium]